MMVLHTSYHSLYWRDKCLFWTNQCLLISTHTRSITILRVFLPTAGKYLIMLLRCLTDWELHPTVFLPISLMSHIFNLANNVKYFFLISLAHLCLSHTHSNRKTLPSVAMEIRSWKPPKWQKKNWVQIINEQWRKKEKRNCESKNRTFQLLPEISFSSDYTRRRGIHII